MTKTKCGTQAHVDNGMNQLKNGVNLNVPEHLSPWLCTVAEWSFG
ncbi:hypothetical protein [Fibrella arboris]